MTFQQLTYVVEISKCGSINKASHKLFLSQSGISTAVRELEEELGIQFFVRSNRGVEFTPEGKEFLSYAVSLLEQKKRIESLYGEARNTSAPVRFSVSTQRYPFTEDAFLRMLETTDVNRFCFSIKETGMDVIRAHETALSRRFYAAVRELPGVTVYGDFIAPERAPIVALNIAGLDSAEVSDELAERFGIATRPGAHCAPRLHRALGTTEQGAVRFSWSYFNTEAETDAAADAVRVLAEEAR